MSDEESNPFMLSDRAYNWLKRLVQIIFPACASLYFGLAQIWGLPAAEKVLGTIAVLTTFLGVGLGVNSKKYYKSDAAYDGNLVTVAHGDDSLTYSLELNGDPNDLKDKKAISFRVTNELSTPADVIPLDNQLSFPVDDV